MLRFRSKWWITLLVILAISFCPLLLVVKAKTWTSHFLHLHKLIPAANLTNHSKSPLSAAFSLPLAYCSANNPLSSTWHCGHSTRQDTATCSHTDIAEPDGYQVKLPFWIIYQHPPLQLDMDVLPQDICCPKKLPVGCRPNSRHTVHKNSYPCSLLTQPASRTAAMQHRSEQGTVLRTHGAGRLSPMLELQTGFQSIIASHHPSAPLFFFKSP